MFGERPVPLGTQVCSSDRNQYLETGELNDEGRDLESVSGGLVGPGIGQSHIIHGHNDQHAHPMQMQEIRNSILVGGSSSGNGPRLHDPQGVERNSRDAYMRDDEDGSSGEEVVPRTGRGISPNDSEIDTVESGKEMNNGNAGDSDEKDEKTPSVRTKILQGSRRQRDKVVREGNLRDGPPPPSLRLRKTSRDSYMEAPVEDMQHQRRDLNTTRRDRDGAPSGSKERERRGRGGRPTRPRTPERKRTGDGGGADSYVHSDECMSEERDMDRYRSTRTSVIPHRERNRDREWDRESQSNRYYAGRAGGYPDEDEPFANRPWSRNDYYGRDMPDYSRRPHRDSYYDDRHGRDEFEYSRRFDRGNPRAWDYVDTSRHESSNMSRGGYGAPQIPNQNPRELVEFLEDFRVRDRVSYRKWYEKYLIYLQNPSQTPFPTPPGYPGTSMVYPSGGMFQTNGRPGYQFDRQASGRSSRSNHLANEDLNRSQSHSFTSSLPAMVNSTTHGQESSQYEFRPISSQDLEESSPSRHTPQKFISGHSIGVLNPLGQLVKVSNGGPILEICNVKQVMKHLPEFEEIESFSGPLVKGKTYKKNVIKFCQKKIKEAQTNVAQVDRENFILIWELLILLIRQNGSVVGSDIAELLLKKNTESAEESGNQISQKIDEKSENILDGSESTCETKNTQKFCDLLLYGHKKDALEFAVSNSLWGHALFLASKMGEKEYGHVLARFANGLSFNHPLQTLYQILSGKQPSSVTSCCDESFGDWRPHLSMILSNTGHRPDLEHKTIVTLGDTLSSGNHVFAAQFCYLMAELEFSPCSKLGPLLGLSPGKENVIEATQMTEVYEFARSLAEPNISLGLTFVQYKFEYLKNLVDFGFTYEAYSYCEKISKQLLPFKNNRQENVECLKWAILQISDRLKCCEELDIIGHPSWILDLKVSLKDEIPTEDATPRRGSETSSIEHIPHLPPIPTTNPTGISLSLGEGQTDSPASYNTVGQSLEPSIVTSEQNIMSFDESNRNQYQYQDQPISEWNNTSYPHEIAYVSPTNLETLSHVPPLQTNFNTPPPIGPYYMPQNGVVGANNYNQPPLQSMPIGNGPVSFGRTGNFAVDPSHGNEQPNYINKKKTVRFEDEENIKESKHCKSEVNLRTRSENNNRSRSALKNVQFDSITECDCATGVEIENMANSDDNGHETIPKNKVVFKSTFPIDLACGHLSKFKNHNRNSKTFQIDKKCCDVDEPCDEHDSFRCGNKGHPSTASSSRAMSAGPNVKGHEKVPKSQTQPQQQQQPRKKEQNARNKTPEEKKTSSRAPGIFANIFGKFIKDNTQMKLPDDKNPSIVWDENTKQWVNKGGDTEDEKTPFAPPPSDMLLMRMNNPQMPVSNASTANMHHQVPMTDNNAQPPFPPSNNNNFMPIQSGGTSQSQATQGPLSLNNKYSLPKGRSLKNNYVDVLRPNGASGVTASQMRLSNTDQQLPPMFTPAPSPPENSNEPSPASFLTPSSEINHGFMPSGFDNQNQDMQQAPQMFDPSSFQQSQMYNYGQPNHQ